jgi:hypothetical protein
MGNKSCNLRFAAGAFGAAAPGWVSWAGCDNGL